MEAIAIDLWIRQFRCFLCAGIALQTVNEGLDVCSLGVPCQIASLH